MYLSIINVDAEFLKPFSSNPKGYGTDGKVKQACVMHGFRFSRDLRLISHGFASQTKALAPLERKDHPCRVISVQLQASSMTIPGSVLQLLPEIPMYCLLENGWHFVGKWSLSLSFSLSLSLSLTLSIYLSLSLSLSLSHSLLPLSLSLSLSPLSLSLSHSLSLSQSISLSFSLSPLSLSLSTLSLSLSLSPPPQVCCS